ncbi:MAG: NAD(+) diphosphatase [Phormidesmis sp.]
MIQQPFAIPGNFLPATAPSDEAASVARSVACPACWWFVCEGANLLVIKPSAVDKDASAYSVPQSVRLDELGLKTVRSQFLGYLGGQPCIAAEVEKEDFSLETDEGTLAFESLRSLYGHLPEDLFAIAARAVQLIAWDRAHQYCGHCATPTTQLATERTKRCPSCGLRQYPQLSPAVIMLIYKGEKMLLARAPRFPPKLYSVLAGFVEPGESLEETVARETKEEVGIEIKNIRYFGSQPWPFPNSLMVGFTAEYVSGDIVPEPSEIQHAAWFDKASLPPVPSRLSIARKLIDWFVAQ